MTSFRKLFSEVPLDKMFFETDDTADVKIEIIYTFAADLLNIDLSELIEQI